MPINFSGAAGAAISASTGNTSAGISASVSKSGSNQQFLRGRDVLNSNLGHAYIEYQNDQGVLVRRQIFELRDISATIEQVKEEVMLINDVMCKHKLVACKGSGSFTIYTGVPDYSSMIRSYINTHRGAYFTITFDMDDPESTRGRRSVTLKDVLIDQHQLGRLSVQNGILDEEMSMTFDEYQINEDFYPVV